MSPINHRTNNTVLQGNGEDVIDLPATRLMQRHTCGKEDDELIGFASFWQPTPDEIKRICEGRPVCVTIFSPMHPPVMLAVDGDPDLPWLNEPFSSH